MNQDGVGIGGHGGIDEGLAGGDAGHHLAMRSRPSTCRPLGQ